MSWVGAGDFLSRAEERELEAEERRNEEGRRRAAVAGRRERACYPFLRGEVHQLEVREEPISAWILRYVAVCLCGWESRSIAYTRERAEVLWKQHERNAERGDAEANSL